MDCSEDTRIQLSKELLKRKQATIREMIVATYGEWPLRGLDVVSDEHLDKNVRIWGYWRSLYHYLSISPRRSAFRVAAKHLTDWHGCASSAHRAVWIKSWVSGKKRFSSLAHERRHIQQYDLNPGTETLADAVMNLLIYPEDKNPYTEANGYTRNSVEDVRYYQKGEEVQAFLEEILVAGYPHWPRLPLKKGELWAVLTNAGLRYPERFAAELQKDTDFAAARSRFPVPDSAIVRHKAEQLNFALEYLPSDKERFTFWRTASLQIYSEMLVSFGDRLGPERFGLGLNRETPYIFFANDVKRIAQNGRADDDAKRSIARKAAQLGDERTRAHLVMCKNALPATQEDEKLTWTQFIDALQDAVGPAPKTPEPAHLLEQGAHP